MVCRAWVEPVATAVSGGLATHPRTPTAVLVAMEVLAVLVVPGG